MSDVAEALEDYLNLQQQPQQQQGGKGKGRAGAAAMTAVTATAAAAAGGGGGGGSYKTFGGEKGDGTLMKSCSKAGDCNGSSSRESGEEASQGCACVIS
jgi:hypothetical protein